MIANFKVDRSRNTEEIRFCYYNGMYVYKATYTVPTLFDEKEYSFTLNTDKDVSDKYIKNKIIENLIKDLEPKI